MEVEQIPKRQQINKHLFDLTTQEEKAEIEQLYLQQLEIIPKEKYADGASEKLKHYLENKKVVDINVYYDSKYKPLDNDVSSSDEVFQKLMIQANIQEYGSNFDCDVYDPKQVIQSQDEVLDNILKKSVKSSLTTLIKNTNQGQGVNSNVPLTGPAAIAARFTGYSTTVKNFMPLVPSKQ